MDSGAEQSKGHEISWLSSRAVGYAVAVLGTLLAIFVRWLLDPLVGDTSPYILFYFPIALAAIIGGPGPGFLALLLGTLAGTHFFVPPRYSLAIAHREDVVLLFFFLGTAGLLALFAAWAQVARRLANERAAAARQAFEQLYESEQRFRSTFENAAVGITHADAEGRWLRVNQKQCEILGYCRQELQGMDFRQITYPDERHQDWQRYGQLMSGQIDTYSLQKRYVRKDGTTVWVEITRSLQRDPAGKPLYSINILQNISERKQAEADRVDAMATCQAAKALAEEASAAKDHFLAVLSHELRTPLTPVLASVSMLQQDHHLSSDTQQALEMIRRNVELEARLIDDLLDITRIVRGKIELERRLVDLRTIIQHAVEVCMPDIEARGLHFGMNLGPGAPYWVQADVARLQQVFWNLLKNAVKFTPRGGCIGIRASKLPRAQSPLPEPAVLIEIYDSGEGIAPEALGRIFNAFEQAERSVTRQFGGLGLGLAISKALVEMHGGVISAHSDGKGKGATFQVRLPLLSRQGTEERTGAPANRREDLSSKSRVKNQQSRIEDPFPSPLRILLVEDHGDTARIMRRFLEAEGHYVQPAGDLASALALSSQEEFDLLISDLGLPDGSGLDLMRSLRERGLDLAAIALSGYGREEDIQRSREAGFAVHLTKPIDPDHLLRTIGRIAAVEAKR